MYSLLLEKELILMQRFISSGIQNCTSFVQVEYYSWNQSMKIRWNQSRSSVCVFTKKKMAELHNYGKQSKKKESTACRRIIHCNI